MNIQNLVSNKLDFITDTLLLFSQRLAAIAGRCF